MVYLAITAVKYVFYHLDSNIIHQNFGDFICSIEMTTLSHNLVYQVYDGQELTYIYVQALTSVSCPSAEAASHVPDI